MGSIRLLRVKTREGRKYIFKRYSNSRHKSIRAGWSGGIELESSKVNMRQKCVCVSERENSKLVVVLLHHNTDSIFL